MGFGRGKGFTSKVRELMFRVIIRFGGGKAERTETITSTVVLAEGSYP